MLKCLWIVGCDRLLIWCSVLIVFCMFLMMKLVMLFLIIFGIELWLNVMIGVL